MEKRELKCLCVYCGKATVLEYQVVDGLPAHYDYGRECKFCKELGMFPLSPIRHYANNVVGILKRIKTLENRVKELEESV